MPTRSLVLKLLAILLCASGSTGYSATVDFESIALGTNYGKKFGHSLGETVLVQNGISMSLSEYYLDDYVGFNQAQVGGSFDSWFKTTPLELDNIGVTFDFTNVGFDVTQVTLEFIQFGGDSSFSVNGSSLLKLLPTGKDSWKIGSDVRAFASSGMLTLKGQIDYFQIGGQELVIDNIIAVPEPATAWLVALSAGWLLRRRPGRSHAQR